MFTCNDRQELIVRTQFQIFKMAEAVRTRMARMTPPLVAPPMTFPPVLSERVA